MSFLRRKNFLSNEEGYSIPLVMILASVGGMLVYSMSEQVISSSGITSRRNEIVTFETFTENFKNVVQDPGACTRMLKGKLINISESVVTRIDNIDRDFDNESADKDDLTDTWEDPEKTFGIDRMEMEILNNAKVGTMRKYDPADYADFSPTRATPVEDVHHTYAARLMIHPKGIKTRLKHRESGDDTEKKAWENKTTLNKNRIDIRLFVNVDNNGVIQSCYGYSTEAAACAAVGGTYDFEGLDTVFEMQRCKPDDVCFSSPAGLVNDPSACPAPYNVVNKDGLAVGGQEVGRVNGVTKYLCQWCHPYAGDTDDFDTPSGATIRESLEEMWRELAERVERLMVAGHNPFDVEVSPLAMEWTALVSQTIDSGVAVNSEDPQYAEAYAAVQELERLQLELVMKGDEVRNLEYEVEDLNDELDALRRAGVLGLSSVSSSQLNTAQQRVNSAQAALDADPNNTGLQRDLTNAQEDYDSVSAFRNNPNLEQDLRNQLATAEANLATARSEYATLQTDVAAAQARVDSFNNIDGSGMTASEFVNPTNAVNRLLIQEFKIKKNVVQFADQARGA